MAKIRKGDTVVVTAGKDRTKRGRVLRVFTAGGRVFVEGIVRKKHKRSRSQEKKGEVITVPLPIAISAVKLICPKCGKAARVGYTEEGGARRRVCKKCKGAIDV